MNTVAMTSIATIDTCDSLVRNTIHLMDRYSHLRLTPHRYHLLVYYGVQNGLSVPANFPCLSSGDLE
jgi:hypothetical protein